MSDAREQFRIDGPCCILPGVLAPGVMIINSSSGPLYASSHYNRVLLDAIKRHDADGRHGLPPVTHR